MATGFIKKNWQKDATANLIQSGARIAGGTVTAWGLQKFFGPTKSDGTDNKTMHNIGGPLMLALGVLGDMMLESPNLRAVCQGITTYAGLHSIAVISPAPNGLAPKLGLAGMGGAAEDAALMSGIGALGTSTATDENSTTANPPELTTFAAGQRQITDGDGKTYNNDWAYLAQNIDNADQITRTVNGPADEAAALMGVDTPQEAARLMGMF